MVEGLRLRVASLYARGKKLMFDGNTFSLLVQASKIRKGYSLRANQKFLIYQIHDPIPHLTCVYQHKVWTIKSFNSRQISSNILENFWINGVNYGGNINFLNNSTMSSWVNWIQWNSCLPAAKNKRFTERGGILFNLLWIIIYLLCSAVLRVTIPLII